MPRTATYLLSFLAITALLADAVFIVWATKVNFWVVAPSLLGAGYLIYLVVYYLRFDGETTDTKE
ncbi:MAG TPA: hypothetical protein VEH78_07420 [Pseudolabrys sp.]|nr:hypothetical protein [Pseudolabrys sp.]HXZ22578.1 hypothetical protein [Pseudolabrys sp.]